MKPSELLENGWCQTYLAVDAGGNRATAGSRHAVAHCIVGAGIATLSDSRFREFTDELCLVLGLDRPDKVVDWNNAGGRKKAEVIAVAREAERRLNIAWTHRRH